MQNPHIQRNLKAASLSALLFVYLVLLLSTTSVKYLETSHRVTVQRVFDEALFGSLSTDGLAAFGLLMLFVAASIPSRKVMTASTAALWQFWFHKQTRSSQSQCRTCVVDSSKRCRRLCQIINFFSVTSGLSQESILAGNTLSPTNFSSRLEALDFTFSSYVGGFLSNPVIMALALLWVFRSSYQKAFDRLLLSMIFLLAVPILFGSSDIQARVFFVVMLFIPALLSLNSLRQHNNETFFLAVFAPAISMAVYALRAITNMDLVLPEGYEVEEPFLIP